MDGLGEALGRFNKTLGDEPAGGETAESKPPKKAKKGGGGKGHTFHVHRHTDGTHHLTVHGEDGQLMHHSEHGSLDEAAEEMKAHGGEGGEPPAAGAEGE
jgi:hypothetical protein